MSDDNNANLLLGLGLGYLLGKDSAGRQARREKEQKKLDKEILKLDKQTAKDRGQTLEEYRAYLEQQAPTQTNTKLVPFSAPWYGAVALNLLFWTLVILYPVATIAIVFFMLTLFVVVTIICSSFY